MHPLGDFRNELNIPNLHKLFIHKTIKPIIIDKNFPNAEEYLSVNYWLLWEDFIHDLREGVGMIRKGLITEDEKKRVKLLVSLQ